MLSVSLTVLVFYKLFHFLENATALDPEEVTGYSKGSVKQPELDDLLPSVPPLPSFALPAEIPSETTLATDSDSQETKLLLNSTESPLTATPAKPDGGAACEQKAAAAAAEQGPE